MLSVWCEGNWEAGRPVVSERRLPVLVTGHQREGERSRESLNSNIAGPLGGSRRVGVRVGVEASKTTDWWWEEQSRARERDCGSRAPGRGTHSGFVINVLGSPRAAQLSSL